MKALLLALMFAACVTSHAANAPVESLLRRMDNAMAQQTYDGVFTYMRGDSVSSLRIMHTVINGVHYERLIHLDGSPREILRIGSKVLCSLMPGDELADLTDDIPVGPFAQTFVRNYRQIPGQYRLVLNGMSRVAGRAAQMISIDPVDADRYAHQLWLDEATGMLLKSQLVAADGSALEVFQFAQISLGRALAAREFVPTTEAGKVVHVLNASPAPQRTSAASRWRVGWLPKGFSMAAHNVRPAVGGAAGLQTMFYGDGLAALSVFIEPMPSGANVAEPAQIMREGATVALSVTAHNGARQGYLVTVVGEVPRATAERVARSVLEQH